MEEPMRKKVLQDEEGKVQLERAEEKLTAKRSDIARGKGEYVIDQVVDHSNEKEKKEV